MAVVAIICLIPCIVSGSRSAILAICVSTVVVAFVSFRLTQAGILFAAIAISGYLVVERGLGQVPFLDQVASRLLEKGFENTRSHLWEARLEEFRQHPVAGVGVGIAEGAGGEYSEENKFNVEPGSSYLAVLSMTGLTGAAALVFVLFKIVQSYSAAREQISLRQHTELLAIWCFLAVHALAEGWFLAVGSPFSFLFWLCCGRALDIVHTDAAEAPLVATEQMQRKRGRKRIRRRLVPREQLPHV